MIMITAIIQPFRLEHVRSALLAAEVSGLTVSQCTGYGRNPKMVPSFRCGPDVPELVPSVQIQLVVPSSQCRSAIAAIMGAARTGNAGDGKLFVSRVDRVITIRTGAAEQDIDAGVVAA